MLYSINGFIEIRKWRRGKPSKLPQANHISRNEGFKTQPCQPTQMKLHLQVLHNQLQQKERPPSQHEISFLAAVYHFFHHSIHSAIEQASVFSGGSGVDASKTLREFDPTTCYDPQRPLVALVGEATNDIFDTLPDSAPITIQQSRPGGVGLRIWKGWGCSSEVLNKSPKGDRSGRGPSFFWPLKETMLKHRQMKNTVTFNDGRDITIKYFYP